MEPLKKKATCEPIRCDKPKTIPPGYVDNSGKELKTTHTFSTNGKTNVKCDSNILYFDASLINIENPI